MNLNRSGRRRGSIPGLLLLLLVLALGAAFRFVHVSQQGPRLWDEGIYLKEARFMYTLAEAVGSSSILKVRELVTREDVWKQDEQIGIMRDRVHGSAPIFGRMTHDAMLAFGMIFWGLQDIAVGARVNAAAGTLSVLVLYVLARKLYGGKAALVCTLVFSLSGYHIHYSRSTMAETTTLLFLLVSFWFYAGSRSLREHLSLRSLALSAFFLGLSFTTHNRMLVMWGLFVLYEAALWFLRTPGQPPFALKRFVVFHASFLLPLAAWETPYYLAFLITKHLGIVVTAPTYFEQVFVALGRSALWGYISKAYRAEGFLTFPYLFVKSCGAVPLLLALAGLVAGLRRRSFPDFLVTTWFLIPLAFYSLTTAGLSRLFTVILPATALLAGRLFSSESKALWLPRPSDGIKSFCWNLLLILLLIGNGVYYGWRNSDSEDGYAEAAAWLRSKGADRIISTNIPILEIYFGEDRVAKSPPSSREELDRLRNEGNTFYVMDYCKPLYGLYQKDRLEVMNSVSLKRKPSAVIPNSFVQDPLTLFEANLYFWDSWKLREEISGLALDRIEIYDLGGGVDGEAPGPSGSVKEGNPG